MSLSPKLFCKCNKILIKIIFFPRTAQADSKVCVENKKQEQLGNWEKDKQ